MSKKMTKMKLQVENMLAKVIGESHGLDPTIIDDFAPSIASYSRQIQERRDHDIGFMNLPYDKENVEVIKKMARELRSWCKNFVVLGIGGSALGNITLRDALLPSSHNVLAQGDNSQAPRIFVFDNIDPAFMADLKVLLKDDLAETAFNVITKSGSTAETMSQFLHVRELLKETDGCDPRRQMVLTTDPDPEKSLLRRIGQRDGYPMLPIPADVGGRFSVLSSVGLLTAGVGGIDIDDLLLGAAEIDAQCQKDDIRENPAALYATLLYRFYQREKPISVLMPYSQRLRALAFWYCQLWAESLGKKDGLTQNDVFQGPTPVPSVGVTDQHSVMQLYQDGPFDKVITFIEVENPHPGNITISQGKVEEDMQYLSGKGFNDLFNAELQATRFALRDKKRPNCTIKIPSVNAHTLGQLFMFFEYAVTFSGYLYDVNAFDQPGVELGKRYTYGLMGRKGYKPPET